MVSSFVYECHIFHIQFLFYVVEQYLSVPVQQNIYPKSLGSFDWVTVGNSVSTHPPGSISLLAGMTKSALERTG